MDRFGKRCKRRVAFKFRCINYYSIIITWFRLWRFIYTMILCLTQIFVAAPIPSPPRKEHLYCLYSLDNIQFAKIPTWYLICGNIHLIFHSQTVHMQINNETQNNSKWNSSIQPVESIKLMRTNLLLWAMDIDVQSISKPMKILALHIFDRIQSIKCNPTILFH